MKLLLAAFGEDQVLSGIGLVHELYVVELHVAAGPGLIPVKTDAPHVFGRIFIVQYHTGPLKEKVAVMIPCNEFFIAEALRLQSWSEKIFNEVPFLFGGKDA